MDTMILELPNVLNVIVDVKPVLIMLINVQLVKEPDKLVKHVLV